MFSKSAGILIIAVSLLCVSCGGSSSSTGSSSDTMTLTVNGIQTQYADSAQDVTITAYTSNGGTNMVMYLGAPGIILTITFSNDALATAPTRTASITCIIGGYTYQGTANCTLTSLATSMGGQVQGSFPTATLTANSLLPLSVSGSFSATRIN